MTSSPYLPSSTSEDVHGIPAVILAPYQVARDQARNGITDPNELIIVDLQSMDDFLAIGELELAGWASACAHEVARTYGGAISVTVLDTLIAFDDELKERRDPRQPQRAAKKRGHLYRWMSLFWWHRGQYRLANACMSRSITFFAGDDLAQAISMSYRGQILMDDGFVLDACTALTEAEERLEAALAPWSRQLDNTLAILSCTRQRGDYQGARALSASIHRAIEINDASERQRATLTGIDAFLESTFVS